MHSVSLQDGLIHKDEFLYGLFKKKDKGSNVLVDKIFQNFATKRNDVIDFEEFVHSLSIFHPNAALEEKAACAPSSMHRAFCHHKSSAFKGDSAACMTPGYILGLFGCYQQAFGCHNMGVPGWC